MNQSVSSCLAIRTPLFSDEELVSVEKAYRRGQEDSDGGIGYIVGKPQIDDNQESSFTIKYIQGTTNLRTEHNVSYSRIHKYALQCGGRRRPGNFAVQPSLLSPSISKNPPTIVIPAKYQSSKKEYGVAEMLKAAAFGCLERNPAKHPVAIILKSQRKKLDKGWLRVLEAKRRGDDPIRLSHYLQDIEREQVVRLLGMISILGKRKGFTVADDLAFAFGQTRKTLGNLKRRAQNSDGFDAKRKRRNYLGDSIFNSKKKRGIRFSLLSISSRRKPTNEQASLTVPQHLILNSNLMNYRNMPSSTMSTRLSSLLKRLLIFGMTLCINWGWLRELSLGNAWQVRLQGIPSSTSKLFQVKRFERISKSFPISHTSQLKWFLHWIYLIKRNAISGLFPFGCSGRRPSLCSEFKYFFARLMKSGSLNWLLVRRTSQYIRLE